MAASIMLLGARVTGMANVSELMINVVKRRRPMMLKHKRKAWRL
jgi:hypothetical protein